MNAWILFLLGILFAICEILFMDFTLIFFGISLIIVGLLSLLFSLSIYWQISLSIVIALLLIIFCKKYIRNLVFRKSEFINQEFLDENGIGIIKNNMIYYKGTFWQSNEISNYKEGDKIDVLGIKNGKIIIKTRQAH